MPLWLQHLLVLSLVAVCVTYIGWQVFRTLARRGSKLGSCCATGCESTSNTAKQNEPNERIVFLPAEQLFRRRGPKKSASHP